MDMENNMKIYDSLPDGLATLATMEKELGIKTPHHPHLDSPWSYTEAGTSQRSGQAGRHDSGLSRDVRELAESRSLLENGHSLEALEPPLS